MSERGGKRSRPVTAWIVVATVVVWLVWAGAARRIPLRSADRAEPAAPLSLLDSTERTIALEELRGQVVLLQLWADWCAPCRKESPRLTRLQHELADRGLVVLGLNADGLPPEELARIRADWGMDYRVGSATRPLDETAYRGRGVVPHHWLIDRRGRLRASRAGTLSEGALRASLRKLLDEGAPDGKSDPATQGGDVR